MRSTRIVLMLVGSLLALVAAPSVAASATKEFHVVKDCEGLTCVITSSTYRGIPAGSVINYTENTDGSLTAVISGAHGTATGRCDLANIVLGTGPGTCIFASGTGSLTAFRLVVDVTTSDGVTWFWDGSYSMGA